MNTSSQLKLRSAAVVLALSLIVPAFAQDPALPNNPTPKKGDTDYSARATANDNKLSHADKAFFEKAAKAGNKEVDVSQSVSTRLMNPQVKDFAQMMVSDHTAANTELMALAARKGVTLPSEDKAEKMGEKWASKKDKDLDQDYISEMKDDHDEAVKLFEKASKSEDPDIAAFAMKTLPKLQQHLQMAKTLKSTLK